MYSFLLSPLLHTFAAETCTKTKVLGLVPWYNYLPIGNDTTGTCSINFTTAQQQPQSFLGLHSPLLLVGLAVIDDLLIIAAYVAVGYVIWGGMQYTTSQGSPDKTKKAQGSIINALAGLVIALLATAIVSYLGTQLGGSNQSGLPNPNPASAVPTMLDLVFAVTASISVLMAVIGGFKYVASNGDPNQAASAKNTILYAIIGLIVVMAAYSIVTFVVKGVG